MVLILDGNSEHVTHAWRKMGLLGEKKIQFLTAFVINRLDKREFLLRAQLFMSYHLVQVP